VTVTTIDPATSEPLAAYQETTPDELDAVLAGAHAVAADWRITPRAERATALGRLASALRAEREELALLATREMGKPLAKSRAEVDKCAWCCEWFADHGPAMLAPDARNVASNTDDKSLAPIRSPANTAVKAAAGRGSPASSADLRVRSRRRPDRRPRDRRDPPAQRSARARPALPLRRRLGSRGADCRYGRGRRRFVDAEANERCFVVSARMSTCGAMFRSD
jgi:hypothetical protein